MDACHTMNESQMHYAKRKARFRVCVLLEQAKLQGEKTAEWLPGAGAEGKGLQMDARKLSVMMAIL